MGYIRNCEPQAPEPLSELWQHVAFWQQGARYLYLATALMVVITYGSAAPLGTPKFTTILFSPYAALVVFAAVAIAAWILKRNKRANAAMGLLRLAASFYLVFTSVIASGGLQSPALFLFLPLVAEAAIVSSRASGVAVAVAAVVFVGGISIWPSHRLVWAETNLPSAATPPYSALVILLWLAVALICTALGAALFARRASSVLSLIERYRGDLAASTATHHGLLNGIQDAVLITDAAGVVTSWNRPTEVTFGVIPRMTTVAELLRRCRAKSSGPLTLHEFDLEIPNPNGQEMSRLRVQARTLTDQSGHTNGRIYICRDITKLRSMEGQLEIQERLARMLAERDSIPTTPDTKLEEFVGESKVMQRIFKLITRVAPTDATVLVNGESGTGKELVAKALHLGGARAKGPFVPVNCGAIPEALLESELFGHKKGAFTGADSDAQGLFRKAHGGTLFLDEIGELPITMQVKLLRAIQEKTVRPVGGDLDIPIDVRVVAATNRNLRAEVAAGRFREDLYYRLNVINIQLPALRDRKEDIPLLISSALRRLRRTGPVPVVTPAAMQMLLRYPYPGNVRELENILERALVLGGEVILAEHLPEHLLSGGLGASAKMPDETVVIETEAVTLPVALDDILLGIEQRYIKAALTQAGGGKKRAAELLGINFRSFRYRVQKFSNREPSQHMAD